MQRLILFFVLWMGLSMASLGLNAQNSTEHDLEINHHVNTKYHKEVLAYDKKHCNELFFSSFDKQNDPNSTVNEEEYYTYTIKIAIYSEKLRMRYKDQKETIEQSKAEWFDIRYEAYLQSKK